MLDIKCNTPPKWASCFLKWSLPKAMVEPLLGDLFEEFELMTSQIGLANAKNWYCKQAIKTGLRFIFRTQGGVIMFLISVLIFAILTLSAMALGGEVSMFIDLISMVIVIVPALSFSVAATSFSTFKNAWAALLTEQPQYSTTELKQFSQLFILTGNTALLVGAAMTLLGWVAMASNISAEEFPLVFGPSFAVSILTMIYALLLKTLCYVAQQRVLNQCGLLE